MYNEAATAVGEKLLLSGWHATLSKGYVTLSSISPMPIYAPVYVSFDSHTDVLFKEQMILKFPDIYLYQIGKFMYLFKKGLLPNYFQDMFILASQVHSYNTRNSNRKFYIFPFRTNFRKFSIRFQGPKFFNSLNQEIQDSESTVLVCLPKDLKRSFLFTGSHINPFKELHTCFLLVCFIVTFFLNT